MHLLFHSRYLPRPPQKLGLRTLKALLYWLQAKLSARTATRIFRNEQWHYMKHSAIVTTSSALTAQTFSSSTPKRGRTIGIVLTIISTAIRHLPKRNTTPFFIQKPPYNAPIALSSLQTFQISRTTELPFVQAKRYSVSFATSSCHKKDLTTHPSQTPRFCSAASRLTSSQMALAPLSAIFATR